MDSRFGPILAAAVVVALASAPYWTPRADMRLLVEAFYFLALAQMWNLLAGFAGLVSVGQQAYVGLGGYAMFILAGFLGINPVFALPMAGAFAVLIAFPTSFVVFRLQGAYFAIGTWVIAEVFRLVFVQIRPLGGGAGMSLPVAVVRGIADGRWLREAVIYWSALGLAVAALAVVYFLLRSKYGLALTAVRDSERAAESVGVDNRRVRRLVYLLVAFFTGTAGALIFLQKLRISPNAAFDVNEWTAFVIFIVVIGGIGRIEGPIVGTTVFIALRELLADWGAWYLIILGVFAVIVMLRAPNGIWGWIAVRWGIELFPVRRRVGRLPPRR